MIDMLIVVAMLAVTVLVVGGLMYLGVWLFLRGTGWWT